MLETTEARSNKKKRSSTPKPSRKVTQRPPVPILSLDQSYTDTGISLIGDDAQKYTGQALHWTNFTFKPASMPKWQKREVLGDYLAYLYHEWQPNTVVLESVDFWRDGDNRAATALVLITLASFIVDTMKALDKDIEIYMIPTKSWKDALLQPDARKGKQGTMTLMSALVGTPIRNDNIADSLAIGYCAYQHPHLLKVANI